MIKLENTEVMGWMAAIRGMRNPLNSWDKSDTLFMASGYCENMDEFNLADVCGKVAPIIGENDLSLMKKLAKAGADHRKFMRMIAVYVEVTAPMYWWKEADTYKVGTVRNSCSTMHTITNKEFTLDDFSCEHLIDDFLWINIKDTESDITRPIQTSTKELLRSNIQMLNRYREFYLETKDKKYWWQIIQLLPSSYNQRSTLMLNYEVLANIYHSRKDHKLDEWKTFCKWIESLPYSEIMTGEE